MDDKRRVLSKATNHFAPLGNISAIVKFDSAPINIDGISTRRFIEELNVACSTIAFTNGQLCVFILALDLYSIHSTFTNR